MTLPATPASAKPQLISPAICVLAAGVGAAVHIGKLPPALPVLGEVLGVSLLEAGFLLSAMQFSGMLLGLLMGLAVQRVGAKRSMVMGLLTLALGSALGALAGSTTWLLATRVIEGLGFLWVVLPAPGLLRQLVSARRVNRVMGFWGCYMPLGTSLGVWAAEQNFCSVADNKEVVWCVAC